MTLSNRKPGQPAQRISASHANYAGDVHAWAFEQAELVEAGQFAEIDMANIAEELRSLGRSEYRALESALTIVLLHLLKWDCQPERRSRGWALSIAEHRDRVMNELRDSPSLKSRLGEALASAHSTARLRAARETRLSLERFPVDCPYDWSAAMERPVPIDR